LINKYINDAIKVLCDYIKIDTSHPYPNYKQVFEMFSKMAYEDGFECRQINLSANRNVLVVLQRGLNSALPTLALNHHMDVVAGQEHGLGKYESFLGTFENNVIYGRGTQDMKGVGIAHYHALKAIKKIHGCPQRTICLLIVPDEEIGGFSGVGELVKLPEFKDLNIKYILDEGLSSGDDKKLLIKVSERKVLQLKIESYGQQSHSSRLFAQNSLHSIVNFLSGVVRFQHFQQNNIKSHCAGLYLSTNITSLSGGIFKNGLISVNTIPPTASATVDIRIPPNAKINEIKHLIFDYAANFGDIKITILAESFDINYKPYSESIFYNVLKSSISENGLIPEDHYDEGASDLRFYLQNEIDGYGISPFTIKPNIHGIDECLRVKDLEIGITVFYDFLKNFCL
jgi:aminoacylase